MKLPVALSPWAEILNQLPKATAISLGKMIRRLAQAIGPLKYAPISGIDEPDGFSGLTNKGTVEHLLPSEWLLAQEIPHEFDRRAAMGEQLFFRPHRVEFKEARTSTVLFDSGPGQIGSPRIAHLALLILFERRAKEAGAAFFWGVLQEPAKGWMDQVDIHAITGHLLPSGTWQPPNTDMLNAWQEHAKALGTVEDCWLIGDNGVNGLMPGSATVEIRDEPEPHRKVLSLWIRKNARARGGHMSLDLPDEPTAAQLLRDPFTQAEANMTTRGKYAFKPDAPLLFSKNGLKIAVLVENHGVVVYPIPNTAKEPMGRPRAIFADPYELLIGVELLGKRIMSITKDGAGILKFNRFPELPGARTCSLTLPDQKFQPPGPGRLCRICYTKFQNKYRIMILDAKGALFTTDWPIASETLVICDQGVTSVADLNGILVYTTLDEAKKTVRIVSQIHDPISLNIEDGASGKVFLGAAGWKDTRHPGVFAVNTKRKLWLTRMGTSQYLLNPGGAEVVGVVAVTHAIFADTQPKGRITFTNKRPCLVTLSEDRKIVSVFNKDHHTNLINSAAQIVRILVDPLRDHIAYTTKAGDLVVFNLRRKSEVMRVTTGEER